MESREGIPHGKPPNGKRSVGAGVECKISETQIWHLADIFISRKLSAAVDDQPDKLWECELERSRASFV